MTDDELRKLAEAALADDKVSTPGPWTRAAGNGIVVNSLIEDVVIGSTRWAKDARLIAAARTREPELARAVLRLLGERETRIDPTRPGHRGGG